MKKEWDWRTRPDPFAEVWEEVTEQLQQAPRLEARTVFAALQRKYPERSESQVPTPQRGQSYPRMVYRFVLTC